MKTNGYIYIDSYILYILSEYCDKASFVLSIYIYIYIYKAFHTEWAALLGSGSLLSDRFNLAEFSKPPYLFWWLWRFCRVEPVSR